MIKRFRLKGFKNFKDAELSLGAFTLLVGTNASGKSNVRDAFRFLHGIGRGYSLPDIIGEKRGEGGEAQWLGIRGGARELTFEKIGGFELEILLEFEIDGSYKKVIYKIEVHPLSSEKENYIPTIYSESLQVQGESISLFNANRIISDNLASLSVKIRGQSVDGLSTNPQSTILSRFSIHSGVSYILYNSWKALSADQFQADLKILESTLNSLESIRFLDLHPDAMRSPSIPGQIILGDRGENLSSVLHDICKDPIRKEALLQWVQALTPMDAVDFDFPSDFTGKVLLRLIEESGQKTSAYSASDGTLRFLAMLAGLLGPEVSKLYFFEELENGLHPTRLHLLVELIEQQVSQGKTQVIATTHSPQLLRFLSPESLEYASLVYRLEDRADAQIKRIMDIPDARRIIEEKDLAYLHESGWLENAVYFMNDEAL